MPPQTNGEVNPATCTTEGGMVLHKESGKKISYGDLVEKAATMPVPTDVKFKEPNAYKIIGTRAINVNLKAIVTGKQKFGIDTKREGMVYATIVRPLLAFGQTLKKALTIAKPVKMPGVTNVVSFDNKIAVLGRSTWEVMHKLPGPLKQNGRMTVPWKAPPITKQTSTKRWRNFRKNSSEKDGNIKKKQLHQPPKHFKATFECPFISHNT